MTVRNFSDSSASTNTKRHEFADVLDNMSRDELQRMCENLLDNEKQMRKELDEARGIIR